MHLDNMSLEPQFITHGGLRIRYLSSPKPSAESVMLLSPWPESMYAFVPVWPYLSKEFSLVALDLPGFGQSDGRADPMTPRAMGEFVVHIDGALKAFIDAGSIEDFRGADPGDIIRRAVSSIRNYDVPDAVRDDYVQSYAGEWFLRSIEYVRNYPTDLADLSPLLADLSTPVQIIVGRDDPYGLVADGQLLHEQLPHSRLDILDCGHNAWEEDAARYSSVLTDWINVAFRKA